MLTLLCGVKGVVVQITKNDNPVGRNVDEVLRLVKAFQYVDQHGEVCLDVFSGKDEEEEKEEKHWPAFLTNALGLPCQLGPWRGHHEA